MLPQPAACKRCLQDMTKPEGRQATWPATGWDRASNCAAATYRAGRAGGKGFGQPEYRAYEAGGGERCEDRPGEGGRNEPVRCIYARNLPSGGWPGGQSGATFPGMARITIPPVKLRTTSEGGPGYPLGVAAGLA
jgi:hypothetical protein